MKFSGIITIDKNNVHEKGSGQRSMSQRSKQIVPKFGRFGTEIPVLIHRWLRIDAQAWNGIA